MDRSSTSTLPVTAPPVVRAEDSWFVALWALAVLFHLAGNGAELLAASAIGMIQLVMAVVACAVVLAPGRRVVSVLGLLYLVVLWLKLPVVGNHEVVLGLVAMLVLVETVGPDRAGRHTDRLLVGVRALLIVSYGFMALSKWNHGFVDPVHSCAVVFAEALARPLGVGGLVDATPVAATAIAATLLIETSIPPLLMWRRTRPVGLVVAVGFHTALALDPVGHVWDFTLTLAPMFLAFAAPPIHRLLDSWIAAARARVGATPRLTVTLVVSLAVAVQGLVMAGKTPLPTWALAYPAALAVMAVTILVAVGNRRTGDEPRWPTTAGSRHRLSPAHLPILALGLAIGVGPYLGLRSAASFNMYSNLRVVNGQSNHWLVPALGRAATPSTAVPVADPVDDPILAYYAERDLLVPVENLNRHVDRGSAYGSVLNTAPSDGSPADYLRFKLAFRRSVDGSGDDRCIRAWGPLG